MKITGHLRAAAFHEAGHVVAAWRNELKLKEATIVPRGNAMGRALSGHPLRGVRLDDGSTRAQVRAVKAIIGALAGPAAHRRHNPRSPHSFSQSSDYREAREIAELVNNSDKAARAYLHWLEIVAREMIDQYWPQVEAVANALIEKRTLSGEELEAVIKASRASLIAMGGAKLVWKKGPSSSGK